MSKLTDYFAKVRERWAAASPWDPHHSSARLATDAEKDFIVHSHPDVYALVNIADVLRQAATAEFVQRGAPGWNAERALAKAEALVPEEKP